ncbi:MAG: Phosphoenolpyruvate-protein phosphotransferase of PTS system [Candidatus Carbobacillus altaicus]|uniref:Phosphoenolpyruvate-protein phosphotransferase of PTS system n=1 Tax=Candidatus Carbonibacillus altaicus TaxID=2163959 RepID=A0A2R6XXT3_9BACL|nr:MAG: Phosphoenolpyruvate-protein phosphotransferase of PTS system [Candidatus Carbobacillus altaicus]
MVAANISRPEELDSLLDSGAEGVGLFRTAGKWVGMCGEMAGDLQAIPLLLGMGLDEFSMSGPAIARAKALIRACDLKACRVLAREALQKSSAEEVKKRLGRFNLFHETPITGKPADEA